MSDVMMVRSLLPDGPHRDCALACLTLDADQPSRWAALPEHLASEIDRFERVQIAVLYARHNGGHAPQIDRVQALRCRAAADAVMAELNDDLREAMESHRKKGGAQLFNSAIRELASRSDEVDYVFSASGACSIAAIGLADEVRSGETPEAILAGREAVLAELHKRAYPDHLPQQWLALALMWVAVLARLGHHSDDETTEHYSAG